MLEKVSVKMHKKTRSKKPRKMHKNAVKNHVTGCIDVDDGYWRSFVLMTSLRGYIDVGDGCW